MSVFSFSSSFPFPLFILHFFFCSFILFIYCTGVLECLQKMSDGFKYIVSVVILQKNNTGFHLFSTCYWDQSMDGTVTVQWDSKSLHCIVTVFGVAL